MNSHNVSSSCSRYQIRVKGHLDANWSDWFDQFEIVYTEGHTLLTGPVADQSALLGLLMKLHDLGLTVIAVNRVDEARQLDTNPV